jgi:5-(aminomethyl)-3-furanmethanol phosphate kinase
VRVVKLGGSLAESPHLRAWLGAIAAVPDIVLVPGGGPFADAVREAQTVMGFGDSAAHRLALLAMEQYGYALCDLEPGLAPASTLDEIRARLVETPPRTPVWMPSALALADPELPRSWDLTSDSLAAWLAGRLGAVELVLVKSVALPPTPISLPALARVGIVDPLLPKMAAGVRVSVLASKQPDRLAAALDGTLG